MKISTNTLYGLAASLFIVGIVGTLAWTKGGKIYGSVFLIASIVIAYYTYRRSNKDVNISAGDVNLKLACLGALLILIDVSYNLIRNDAFRSFDYTMILTGLFIVLLNTGAFGFHTMEPGIV